MTPGVGADPGAGPQILDIGQLCEGRTCLDRMRVLHELGAKLEPLDVTAFEPGMSIAASILHRFHWDASIAALNRAILARASRIGRALSVRFVDKGVWIRPEPLVSAREATGARLIHFTPDPALLFHRSRYFVRSIPIYDLLITTKPWQVDLCRREGARRILLTHQGYDRSRFYSVAPDPGLAIDVTFIGQFERSYAARLRALARAGLRVKIWGPGGAATRCFAAGSPRWSG